MADTIADEHAQVSINSPMISAKRIAVLADIVDSGGVVMESETGQRLPTALRRHHTDDVERWRVKSRELLRPLPMGNNRMTADMGARLYSRDAVADASNIVSSWM
ncbi:hypothetical protein F0L68_08325 [Solihabitans fulvus]|uniref:Uncharacterized protein n=1 Tax=Solihabitans fulvus TaxID=1892852 RepID=A0A5B2XLH5_9PSEU|nr:hypothetical protein [Solihabitans fulvus]KAA2264233.1 hypothetical protein F0L68_08325 [Solihabitans fulvus]